MEIKPVSVLSTTKLTGTALGLTAGLHIVNLAVNNLFVLSARGRKIVTAPLLNVVNRNLLYCTNYSARKLAYVKFELL